VRKLERGQVIEAACELLKLSPVRIALEPGLDDPARCQLAARRPAIALMARTQHNARIHLRYVSCGAGGCCASAGDSLLSSDTLVWAAER